MATKQTHKNTSPSPPSHDILRCRVLVHGLEADNRIFAKGAIAFLPSEDAQTLQQLGMVKIIGI